MTSMRAFEAFLRLFFEGARSADSGGRRRLRQKLFNLTNADLQRLDRSFDIFALTLKFHNALLVLLERRLRLCALIDFVEIEDLFDLDQGEPNALAAQNELQAAAVAMRIDAVQAF